MVSPLRCPGNVQTVARNQIRIEASREAVFALLAEPERYADWILGTSRDERSERRLAERGLVAPLPRRHRPDRAVGRDGGGRVRSAASPPPPRTHAPVRGEIGRAHV